MEPDFGRKSLRLSRPAPLIRRPVNPEADVHDKVKKRRCSQASFTIRSTHNCAGSVTFAATSACCSMLPAKIRSRRGSACLPSFLQIYTATHPVSAAERRQWLESAKPITIGSDVWVGGGAIICPGVTIGERSVIGAGSVVTRDIPSDVLASGNPARVIRALSPEAPEGT